MTRRLWLAALAAITGFLLMVGYENLGEGPRASQLQLQFAWNAQGVRDTLAAWGEAGRERVVMGLYADYLFLAGYTSLLALLLDAWRRPRWLVFAVLLAGALDAVENLFLFGFIRGGVDAAHAFSVSLIASVKFGLIGIALIHLVIHGWRHGNRG